MMQLFAILALLLLAGCVPVCSYNFAPHYDKLDQPYFDRVHNTYDPESACKGDGWVVGLEYRKNIKVKNATRKRPEMLVPSKDFWAIVFGWTWSF